MGFKTLLTPSGIKHENQSVSAGKWIRKKQVFITNIPIKFYSANRRLSKTEFYSSNLIVISLIVTLNLIDQFENILHLEMTKPGSTAVGLSAKYLYKFDVMSL